MEIFSCILCLKMYEASVKFIKTLVMIQNMLSGIPNYFVILSVVILTDFCLNKSPVHIFRLFCFQNFLILKTCIWVTNIRWSTALKL